jgi:hypothetical protein
MSRRDALLLRSAAVWTFFIWAVFVKNLLGDSTRATAFKVVHLTLAVISVAFGVAIWRVASKVARNSRRDRERAGTSS